MYKTVVAIYGWPICGVWCIRYVDIVNISFQRGNHLEDGMLGSISRSPPPFCMG